MAAADGDRLDEAELIGQMSYVSLLYIRTM